MIQVLTGNNDFMIQKTLQEKEVLLVRAEETTPDQIWQQSLFAQNKVIKDFNKWSNKQQKEFVELEHNAFEIYIVLNKLTSKSVLKGKKETNYSLPNSTQEWLQWIKKQATDKHKLILNQNQLRTIYDHTGTNIWAIDSELDRISLFDAEGALPPVMSKLSEVVVWGWLDNFFAKKISEANNNLKSLHTYSPFLLISHLGGRLLGQIMYFDNPQNNLTYYQKKSALYGQNNGWNLENSRIVLKSLLEFEAQIKGEYAIDSFTALILWQNKLLSQLT